MELCPLVITSWRLPFSCSGKRAAKGKGKGVGTFSDSPLNLAKQLAFTSHWSKLRQSPPTVQESGRQSFSDCSTVTVKSDFCCWCFCYRRSKWTLGRYLVISDKVCESGFDAQVPTFIHMIMFNLQNKQNSLVAINYSPVCRLAMMLSASLCWE